LTVTLPERLRRRNTLKLKMTMPTAVLTAFLLILTTWVMFGFFREELHNTIAREQSALVRTLASQIDDKLISVQNHLDALAHRIEPQMLDDPEQIQAFFAREWSSRTLFSRGLALFDREGTVLGTSEARPFLCGEDCPWRKQINITLRTQKPRIYPYVPQEADSSAEEEKPLLLFTLPLIASDGSLLGVLGGVTALLDQNMLGYLQDFSQGQRSFLTLCNSRYMLALKEDITFTRPLTEEAKDLRRRVSAGENITTVISRAEGGDTLSSLHALKGVDWVLGVHEPLEQVYASLLTLKRDLVLALSGKIVLAAVAVWLLMRHLLRPLKVLTRRMVEAEHTERRDGAAGGSIPVPVNGDEFRILQLCFEQLLDRVQRQRRRLEKQLDHLQSLLDAIPNPVFYTDANGRFMGFNKAFEIQIGRPRHLIRGDGVDQAFPQDVAQRVKNCGAEYGMIHQSEESLVFTDGETHPVIFSAASYRQVDNASPGVVGTLFDITKRKKLEDQLRKLSQAVEQSPNSIIVTDINGTIEYVNSTFTRQTGYSADEAIGQNPRILNAGSAPREYFQTLWNTILQGHDWRGEFRNRKKNGELFWEYALISPLKDRHGEVTHFVAVKQDITERKLADRREELTSKVLTLLSMPSARDDKIHDILHLIRDFTGCDYVGLRLKEQGSYAQYRSMDPALDSGSHASAQNASEDAGSSPLEKISADALCVEIMNGNIQTDKPCFTPGGSFWSAPGKGCLEVLRAQGCHHQHCSCLAGNSVALVPLHLDNQRVGMLQVIAGQENMLTRGTVEFLESIAGSIAVAFEHRHVTAQLHEKENKLDFLTLHDPLTELPNRTLLGQKLKRIIAQAQRKGYQGAVLLFDLDRFKTINDSLGHTQGDRLLREIATRLHKRLDKNDLLARLGGDEFAVVLPQVEDIQQVVRRVEQLMEGLVPVIELSGFELYVTASVGVSMFPGDGSAEDDLLQAAEVAMYRAKQSGRNRYQFYRTEMNERNRELLHLESQLRLALERNEFVVYYQPKIDLRTGEVTGAEALLRWHHPEMGIISPADFIPLAEDTGLIVSIGEWVLRSVCAQNLEWNRVLPAPVRVAVNLSARQFMEPDLLEQLDRALRDIGIRSEEVELEITESVAMRSVEESIATMGAMRLRGLNLAIDDFGTGYSSLSYLKRFPIDCLKIDKSFVSNIETDINDAAIVSSIVALAKAMDLRVVAEGIENTNQLRYLQQIGCDEAQGFLLARPMPAEDFAGFVTNWKGLPA